MQTPTIGKQKYGLGKLWGIFGGVLFAYLFLGVMVIPCFNTLTSVFRETDAEIKDSFLVDSKLDRHMSCEIISRTGLTRRSYEDLSAEWEFHNAAFSANIERGSARDVSLDYGKDPRRIVRWATKIFDFFNIE